MNAKYNQIPTDSDASIYTQGLLGGKFVGLTAGGAETYLKNQDQIDFTQSAFVLENLIGQVLANFGEEFGIIGFRTIESGRSGARGENQMRT